MTSLTFQPALDPFYGTFRFLRLRQVIQQWGPLLLDHARILDFYLLFPFQIRTIRLSQSHQKYKKLSDKYAYLKPYGDQLDPPVLFNRMEPIQFAALETLAARSFLDPRALSAGTVKATAQAMPQEVAMRVEEKNSEQIDLIEFLSILASSYELMGDDGLKARTRLSEYRYDAV